MIQRRRTPRPKALWKQIHDANQPKQPANKPRIGYKAFKPKRPHVRGVSKHQAARNKMYFKIQLEFLSRHNRCMVCERPAVSVHHYRGKVGSLLFDTRFFVPMCAMDCHRGVHDNIDQSRGLGLICARGEWNRVPGPDEPVTLPRSTPIGPGFKFENAPDKE